MELGRSQNLLHVAAQGNAITSPGGYCKLKLLISKDIFASLSIGMSEDEEAPMGPAEFGPLIV
jgi:hypothetical protein